MWLRVARLLLSAQKEEGKKRENSHRAGVQSYYGSLATSLRLSPMKSYRREAIRNVVAETSRGEGHAFLCVEWVCE